MSKVVSAFLWYTEREPSMFSTDPAFTTNNKKSNVMIKANDDKRKKGLSPGTIRGLSIRSEERIIANKLFERK